VHGEIAGVKSQHLNRISDERLKSIEPFVEGLANSRSRSPTDRLVARSLEQILMDR
jgi:hypothetical protein